MLGAREGIRTPDLLNTDELHYQLCYPGEVNGASERNRTSNLILTKDLLCLLSYTGIKMFGAGGGARTPDPIATRDPLYRLSYTGLKMVVGDGIEPPTPSPSTRRSTS